MNRSFKMPRYILMGLLAFGAIVLNVGIFRGDISVRNYMDLKESREVLKSTVADLQQENAMLLDEIIKLKESPDYARKVLRDKYHEVDENETIIFFAD